MLFGGGTFAPQGWTGMRRLVMIVAVLGILLMGLVHAAQEGFTLSGRLGATDQEAQEGYFAIDSQTMIVVKPGSEMHAFLRGKVGQRIRVTVEPDRESE
jgi:hypothetical protein